MKRYFLTGSVLGLLLISQLAFAQEGNPFELTPRLPEKPAQEEEERLSEDITGNPFDVVPGKKANRSVRPPEPLADIKPLVSDGLDRFHFVVTILQLLLLASLVTLMRSVIIRVFQAFANDNMFNQLYRDREARGPFSFILLSTLFYLNAGLFVFHGIQQLETPLSLGLFQQLGLATLVVLTLILLKHILLAIIGYIFPVREEVKRYRFLITVFLIVMGLFLIPVNLLLAYGPEGSGYALFVGAVAILVVFLLFRSLRALLIANRKVNILSFHFLLYICTIEIAPVLIFWKLISNQL
jgi:hypothetical protein